VGSRIRIVHEIARESCLVEADVPGHSEVEPS